jgi:chromosome segregation ATPase
VPISNPREIEELKSSFLPSQAKDMSEGQVGVSLKMGPTDLSNDPRALLSGRSDKQAEIKELAQKNEQLEQKLEALTSENQKIKESQLEKVKFLEEQLAIIQKEKERLLPNRQLLDGLKEKGELFEKRYAENKIQQEELRTFIRTLESEKKELMQSQKLGADKSELDALSHRLESSIAAIEALKGENKDLQRFNQDLKNDFEKTQEYNTHLIEKEKLMEYELSKNRAQTLGLEKICEDFKVQIESLTAITSGK